MKYPVILVHGLNDTSARMKHIEAALRNSGCTELPVSLEPSSGKLGIDDLAQQLKSFINTKVAPHQKIDLIGFSMGGLVGRYFLQRLNGINKVRHFISISTPHNGTWVAYLLWNKGAKQMRYKSSFITELSSDVLKLESLKVTSIWTPFDLMILPASSSHLYFGKEIIVKSILHSQMVSNKQLIKAIVIELGL